MSGIFGALGISDTERVMLSTLGQRVVYDAVQKTLEEHNAAMMAAKAIFVEETTSDYKIRYKLPGGGRLQRMTTRTRPGAVKAIGEWDIALPLEDFGAAIVYDRVDFAYMTAKDLDRIMKTVLQQDVNTVRFEILRAIFNNTARTFPDPLYGSLTIQPLANGDSVVYPPVIGSETEATEDHYLESGYAAASISDSNDPFVTSAADLKHHFGNPTGGGNLVSFIHSDQTAKTSALAAFTDVPDRYVRVGQDTAVPQVLPATMPGRILGRHTTAGVWVVEWDWMPSGWITTISLDEPAPLKERIDPADTGLGQGLQLVSEDDDYPFSNSHYSHRFGYGCGNRLNGVVMELGTGGTYSIPSAYA